MTERPTRPERELLDLARTRAGDPEGRRAAGELLRRHRQSVYVWCHRYVKDHERALDMAQDVLLQAYERLDQFEGRSAFSSWLFVIARNRCLNEMRRDYWTEDEELDLLPDERVRFDESLDEASRADRLLTMMNEVLDPVERKAVWLRYTERMPVETITTMLGLDGRSGARGLLQRARRKLRVAIAKEHGEGGEPA
ncbi:MAG: sigma-70 family RNA polymerase sigma factor [Candidatus Krumholzibacteria bacterium]|nr:sigma-70 family RNA polymerase sigma factor [Candidatus Krumholzibacteria bacterium]MDH4336591.1 sigma-70 family RNA polymerase sigma factor [Candidatus Krumholzibacteria bacterium]MDH5270193.1 sigma-70 family RNA polymerase sigma factor [Candidatus Krumholzibacteria bacterium]MDH5627347.1 sigma-70 family RNA polymerase sigma factor [Candidatus Krumholzibacteria bacterium]